MIAKPFDKPRPSAGPESDGWDAEQKMAFLLRRAFEPPPDVLVFNDLRINAAAEGDFAQMDHLVLHRCGFIIIESKTTGHGTGEFHVDSLGQWQRRPHGGRRGYNFACPYAQAQVQSDALRRLLNASVPPLLDKLAGLVQKSFRNFPMRIMVALSDQARLTGCARDWEGRVMKAERIVDEIRHEIEAHRRASGLLGIFSKESNDPDKGIFNLKDAELARIADYLLARHTPLQIAHPAPAPPGPPVVRTPPTPEVCLEALTCRKCRSIRVSVVHRRDHCLLCEECRGYTPLDRTCRACGRNVSIRQRGPDFLRVCDGPGGCGLQVIFWQAPSPG